jgi:predicted RNA-binding Zn ribbon-like protein
MAGESQQQRVRASVQPGGRRPAPGELAIVQAFINTHYDLEIEHGADLLGAPAALARWLAACGLVKAPVEVGASDLGRALAAREALRGLARANGAEPVAVRAALEELDRASRGAPVQIRFGIGGPFFVGGEAGVSGAIGLLRAITARAMIDGTWSRLKVCPGEDCGWAFYDHSRNRAGRWCSMSVCGGRAKARAHYHRRLREGD